MCVRELTFVCVVCPNVYFHVCLCACVRDTGVTSQGQVIIRQKSRGEMKGVVVRAEPEERGEKVKEKEEMIAK